MRFSRPPVRRMFALTLALLAMPIALPSSVAAYAGMTTVEAYSMSGYEVYFGSDHAVFVGTGSGTGGARELSGWYTSVYHTLSIAPGSVLDGTSGLQRIDGVQINGAFTGGNIAQTSPGPNCSNETYAVTAMMANVTRTDAPGKTGTAVMMATLTHYRAWFFGACYVYSARVDGSITVIV
jgi:hypothetical protein